MDEQAQVELWRKSFVDWSESELGFYINQQYNPAIMDWEPIYAPIVWPESQRRALRWAFTRDERGHLPITELWWVDIKKSGKSLIAAAVAQWVAQFFDTDTEIPILSNSRDQSAWRVYWAVRNSILWNPRGRAIAHAELQYTEFLNTRNIVRPIPMNAATQAGSNPPAMVIDEIHAYDREVHEKLMGEMQRSPTRSTSLIIATSYPPRLEDSGPLNRILKRHRTQRGDLQDGIERIPELDDLPVSYDPASGIMLWWNHDPYPWHLRVEANGRTFLQNVRANPALTENEYLRTWEARLVSREDTFMPMDKWDACTDIDYMPLDSTRRGVPMVIGLDAGIKRDSFAAIARGYDPVTQRLPLLDHRIWEPRDFKGRELDILAVAKQWVIDHHRQHRILACYYDPHQLQHMALELRQAGVNMVEVSQNSGRDKADPLYHTLITSGKLRNYPQCQNLRAHVQRAVGRETDNGIRIVKRRSGMIDGAVADAMACYGVMEMKQHFELLARGGSKRNKLTNPFRDLYRRGAAA